MFFDFRHNARTQIKNNYFNNISNGTTLARENWGATLDDVYTISPTTLLDVRANWTYFGEEHGGPSTGFNPTALGFPSYLSSASEYKQMPYISMGGCGSQTSFQCLGNTGASKDPSQSYQIFGDVVKVLGRHTLKFGVDARQYRLDVANYGDSAGAFTFGTSWVNSKTGAAAPTFGGDFASFLMGLPTSGGFDLAARASYHTYYFGEFIQDDWRVTDNFTLNLGLRFDHDSPYYEKLGRTVDGFNTTTASPIEAAAQSAYAASPIPQIPTGNFNVLGGLTYPGPHNGAVYQTNSHLLSPRFGFSWSPAALNGNTVIRGGFGMFVSQASLANLAATGKYSSNALTNQEGFSATTPFVATNDNYLTVASTLDSPFPNGIQQPSGSSLGLATNMGQTISFLAPKMNDPYSLRWNLGVQHTFTHNLLLEVDYIGNHGVHLPVATTQLNVIPRQYLSTSNVRDQAVINTLSATTANPFKGLLPGTSLNGSTVGVAQLLAAYPQFPQGSGSTSTGIIEQNNTVGNSYFESADVRVEKRLSHGLSIIGNYSFSKLMDANTYLNDTDPSLYIHISPFDHTQHFVLATTYDLPFGRGRLVNLSSRWLDAIAGGWVVNGIYTYQTGAPIYWSSDLVYNGTPLTINNRQTEPKTSAINKNAFDLKSSDQFAYHVRTFPTTFANIRQDGINNLDSSVLKNYRFTDSAFLQLRFETFNTLNHPTFDAPSVSSPTSSSFGEITKQANTSRQVQLGARIVF